MRFDLSGSIALLERTPSVLASLLGGLPRAWTTATEGPDTWSSYDIVGHLIHGERTDWMPRLEIILGDGPERRFTPFDRLAQFQASRGRTLGSLLDEFAALRAANLARLNALTLSEADLNRTGVHPDFGAVTARQLLATWTAHDLDHIMQISRVLAVQLADDVGPWVEYLRVVRDRI